MGWWVSFLRSLRDVIDGWLGQQPLRLPAPGNEAQVGAPQPITATIPLPTGYDYHAYLCYDRRDAAVVSLLVLRLRAEGFLLFDPESDIPWGEAISRARLTGLKTSRHIITFLSENTGDGWQELDQLVAGAADPTNLTRRILPMLLGEVPIPQRFSHLQCLAYQDEEDRDAVHLAIRETLSGKRMSDGKTAPDMDAPYQPLGDQHRRLLADYQALLTREHHRFELHGLGRKVQLEVDLAQVWVELCGYLDREMDHEKVGNLKEFEGRAQWSLDRTIPLQNAFALARERVENRRGIAVVGEPGSGKTTLLRQMLLTCSQRGSLVLGLPPGLTPVWLPLRSLPDGGASLEDFIKATLDGRLFQTELRSNLGEALVQRRRPLLLLLDGLDEVANLDRRDEVRTWIKQAEANVPHWYFVVSSRYSGWGDGLGARFATFHVKPLDLERQRQFIERWFNMVLRQLRDRDQAQAEAEGHARRLIEQLTHERPRVRRLRAIGGNPLLLTCLCLVQLRLGVLPRRREVLYQQCVEILLDSWRREVGLHLPWPWNATQARLQPLAWKMCEAGQAEVGEGQLVKWLEEAGVSGADAKVFLAQIRDVSGLLAGWGEDRYAFLHKTFMEFLAARHQVQMGKVAELADHLGERRTRPDGSQEDEGWWDEVTLLSLALCERPAFETFMTRVIESGRVRADQKLLGECIEEAKAPSPAPLLAALGDEAKVEWEDRHEVLNLLGTWFRREATGHERVRAIAEGRVRWVKDLGPEQARVVRTTAMGLAGEARVVVEAERKVGDVYIHLPGVLDLEMVWVPPGTFMMGSDDGDDDEKPIHKVTLTQGYWLSRTPITNTHYRKFVEVTGHPPSEEDGNTRFNAPDQPVVGVNWEDSQAFCKWAGLKLPTEAQWEWAARGPQGRKYPWGKDDPTPNLANYSRDGLGKGGPGRTTPVGSYPLGASWVGALDMAGNVWEWCQDWYDAEYYDTIKGGATDPEGPTGPLSGRAVRGGSWIDDAAGLRSTDRDGLGPTNRDDNIGFRVALPPGHE